MEPSARGILFVLSAPSGTGKSTLVRRLVEGDERMTFSVSYTTRGRREGELDGREYHFVDDTRFDAMLAEDELLEWAHVFGKRYGTGRAATRASLDTGRDLLLDVDVQGGRSVRASGAAAVSVFVMPPDFDTLASRLKARRTDSDAEVARRLALAREEAEDALNYDYVVVNDDLDRATDELRAIVRAERLRAFRTAGATRRIVATFPGN